MNLSTKPREDPKVRALPAEARPSQLIRVFDGPEWGRSDHRPAVHTLEEVLDLPEPPMYTCLVDHLERQVDAFGIHGLSETEQTLWLAHEVEAAYSDGGLLGYRVSPAWSRVHEAAGALTVLGAMQFAAIIERAAKAGREGDVRALDSLEAALAQEREDLRAVICAHARANREALLQSH